MSIATDSSLIPESIHHYPIVPKNVQPLANYSSIETNFPQMSQSADHQNGNESSANPPVIHCIAKYFRNVVFPAPGFPIPSTTDAIVKSPTPPKYPHHPVPMRNPPHYRQRTKWIKSRIKILPIRINRHKNRSTKDSIVLAD